MNRITVIGRVSQDVTVKNINGRNVANFNVAAQNKKQVGTENGRPVYGTNFYHVSAWGQTADVASKYLKKGHRVGVAGDLVIREYSGTDGLKHTMIEINNAEIDLIETRAESEAKANAVAGASNTGNAAPSFTPVEPELPF